MIYFHDQLTHCAKKPMFFRPLVLFCLGLILAGCTTTPPKNAESICAIFAEKDDWYDEARASFKKWGTPIPHLMAIVYQESSYRAKIRPPRKRILGFIPGPRPSSAYGYSQATDPTWDEYRRSTGNRGADRDDWEDTMDFVGWYNQRSYRRNAIAKHDVYRQYLAYHEGHGGYARGSYRSKKWLQSVARRVEGRAKRYASQLQHCEKALQDKGWWIFG